jgi:predicted TIM-barrel enzyme
VQLVAVDAANPTVAALEKKNIAVPNMGLGLGGQMTADDAKQLGQAVSRGG